MQPLTEGALFLIRSIFDFYLFVMMLRIILQWVHADAYNPLVKFIAKITNPPLRIAHKILPYFHGIDVGGVVLLLLLELMKFILMILLATGRFPMISGLIVLAFAELFHQLISIFFYSIFIFVLLSWFAPILNSALLQLLFQLTEPLLRPARRLLPTVAGIDFSPIPVLIFLKLIQIVVTQPLLNIGYRLVS